MKRLREFIAEAQEHTSADTSLNQVSGGLKYAVKNKLIKPDSINIDHGGGRYDAGKHHVESSIGGAQLHVHDPFNRSSEHNDHVTKNYTGKAHYVGVHNVLNVIKEPEERQKALHKAKSFMAPEGKVHITVHEGDGNGRSRVTKQDKGRGSSWQEHRKTSTYVDEVKKVFPESSHNVERKGKHIIVTRKSD